MSTLAERLFPEALRPWLEVALTAGPRPGEPLRVGRLPRPAWAPLAAVLSHWATGQLPTLPVIVLCSHPARFRDELRLWLASGPSALLFAEITVSLLDRPPAFDEAVAQRLEALAALAAARQEQGGEPAAASGCLLVSS
nr:hypothetical protein [Candidatus Dormibacteraeota bacterium]